MKTKFVKFMVMLVTAFALGSNAMADHSSFKKGRFSARLDGFQESPSIMTQGRGDFRAKLSEQTVLFTLKYQGLTAPVKFAHIHFARPGVNGGVIVFICNNDDPNAPANVPACPAEGEKLEGMLTADDVLENAAQGISAGDFDALVRAIKNGATYINVHTDTFPSGEIRGNIKAKSSNNIFVSKKDFSKDIVRDDLKKY